PGFATRGVLRTWRRMASVTGRTAAWERPRVRRSPEPERSLGLKHAAWAESRNAAAPGASAASGCRACLDASVRRALRGVRLAGDDGDDHPHVRPRAGADAVVDAAERVRVRGLRRGLRPGRGGRAVRAGGAGAAGAPRRAGRAGAVGPGARPDRLPGVLRHARAGHLAARRG